MRAKRSSIFVALLAIAHFISNDCSLADEIVNLQSAEPNSAGDILQKQRLDEIRALTAMKNKAAADRDSRGKITSLIRETAENHAAASAEVAARESSALELHESAEKAAKGLYHEKATEQAGEENHGTPIAESAAGTNIGAIIAKEVDLDTRRIPEIMTIGSVLPDSVKSAVNGALESIEHVIQERIIPLMKDVVESIDIKPAEAGPDVAAGKFSDVTSNTNEAAAVADAATNVVIDKVALGADKVALGADKVTLAADKVTLGADKDALGADKVTLGADKGILGADKVALGADKVTLGADKVTLGADKVTLGADKDALGADKVTLGADKGILGADKDALGADKDAPDITPSDILVEQTIFDTLSTISAMLDSVLPESHKASEHVMQQSDQQEKITPVINQVKEPTVPILQPIHTDSAKLDTSSNVESIQTPPVTPDDVVVVDKTIVDFMNTNILEKDIEDIIDDSSEDDAMKEIMDMQQRELNDEIEEGKNILNDKAEAEQAESTAKAAEAAAAVELARLEREEAALKKKKAAAADDWIARTRPGGDAKPGAKLAQTIASGIRGNSDSDDDVSSKMGRERIPESSRKGYQSGGRGNYFAGQTATEKEAENKRREAQNRAKETDKMSAGGGDRRRDLEAKLSPQMRNSALAKQQEQVEEEMESMARRARAVISRKFSRPVESVLKVYNSDNTDLYDVLRVSKEVDDGGLKKAYRSLALSVHPDKNIHPDAKIAFDAIQEAYETLSSPVKKMNYNIELKKRTSKPSLKRIIYQFKGEMSNLKSRILLFWVRVFVRGESELEYKELIGDRMTALLTGLRHTAEHFSLLPTVLDRVRLASEISFDFKRTLLLGSVVSALISDM